MTAEIFHEVAWPVVALVALLLFRPQLARSIDRITTFKLKHKDGTEVEITAKEAASIAQQLLDEADQMIGDIDATDQKLLQKVSTASRPLTVEDLVTAATGQNYVRKRRDSDDPSPELQRLRKLRDRQLIRPAEGGRWEGRKHVQLKRFGEVLLRLRPDKLLGPSEGEAGK